MLYIDVPSGAACRWHLSPSRDIEKQWWLNHINTLRPRQSGHHLSDDIYKGIFLIENVWIPIKFSLKFVPKGPIHNIPALVQIMAWRRPGDKPLSEPMVVSLLTHICVTRPQWVKMLFQQMWGLWRWNYRHCNKVNLIIYQFNNKDDPVNQSGYLQLLPD